MEMLYVILGLFLLILNIAIIVKFFNIASDVRELKNSQQWERIEPISDNLKTLADGSELPNLDQLELLISVLAIIGNKEEAKRHLSLYESKLAMFYIKNKRFSDPNYISRQVRNKIAPLAQLLGEKE